MSRYWLSGRISPNKQYPSPGVYIMNLLMDSQDKLQAKDDAALFVQDHHPGGVESIDEWTAVELPDAGAEPSEFEAFFSGFTKTGAGALYQVKRFENIGEAGGFFSKLKKTLG